MLGCADKADENQAGSSQLQANGNVVATVNGEAIYETDVEFMVERMFGGNAKLHANKDLRGKVLDSLISSKAMQQSIIKDLTPQELATIERKVAAYQEEILVQEYLQRHAQAEPVSAEMVRQYYEKHADEFGAQALRQFQLLRAPASLSEEQQQSLMAAIPTIREQGNWSARSETWKDQYNLQFQSGKSRAGLLSKELEAVLNKLAPGETSDLVYIDGQMHIIRLLAIEQLPPKPLAEVSRDIRQKLAPMQLREAVRKVSEKARANAAVVIN